MVMVGTSASPERLLLLVRIPGGVLPPFPRTEWTLVSEFRDETQARNAFHKARLAIDLLCAPAVLAKAVVVDDPPVIGTLKVLISKDVDHWTLKAEDIVRPTPEQQRGWDTVVREAGLRPPTPAPAARPRRPDPPPVR